MKSSRRSASPRVTRSARDPRPPTPRATWSAPSRARTRRASCGRTRDRRRCGGRSATGAPRAGAGGLGDRRCAVTRLGLDVDLTRFLIPRCLDVDHTLLEVDVAPPQCLQLTAAQPGNRTRSAHNARASSGSADSSALDSSTDAIRSRLPRAAGSLSPTVGSTASCSSCSPRPKITWSGQRTLRISTRQAERLAPEPLEEYLQIAPGDGGQPLATERREDVGPQVGVVAADRRWLVGPPDRS